MTPKLNPIEELFVAGLYLVGFYTVLHFSNAKKKIKALRAKKNRSFVQ